MLHALFKIRGFLTPLLLPASILSAGLQPGSGAAQVVPQGLLRGRVMALPDSQAIGGAEVTIVLAASERTASSVVEETPRDAVARARTDARGRFEVTLDPGRYDIAVGALGFAEGRAASVEVRDGATTEVSVLLEVAPIPLEEIVVAPSTYGIFRRNITTAQVLTREEVQVMPHLGEDIYRSVDRLPGVATYDVTAKIYVRGAPDNEVLTVLDGLELHEPYHLKDWDGALSIIDVESVDEVDLATGGFSAEYGDKSAGVFAMRTTTAPPDRRRTALGLSLMNLTFKSEGSFAQGKGSYLASARRGFLDLLFALTGEDQGVHSFLAHEGDSQSTRTAIPGDLHPAYYDVLGKVQYQVRPNHLLSFHILHAGDDMSGMEEDSTRFNHRYGSSYAWATWDADFSRRWSARTLVSAGRVSKDRNGGNYITEVIGQDPVRILEVRDETDFDFVGLKQDWDYSMSDRVLLKGGFDVRRGRAAYDYFRWRKEYVPNATDPYAPQFSPRWDTLSLAATQWGTEVGAYTSGRVRLLERLTTEMGLRYDRHSHTGESTLAPRVSAALELTPRTTLRGAWGYYHQSHGLQDLWTADGDTTYYPAQRAEHWILGLEYRLANGMTVRVEGYRRRTADPLPEYRNLVPRIEGVREEGPEDRLFVDPDQADARGIELLAKSAPTGHLVWSANYALSVAEEEIDGEWIPRPMDQRHALQLQVAYRPNPSWSVSAGWVYHSPWPYTAETLLLAPLASGGAYVAEFFQPMNGARLPAYHRMDVRASRRFQVGRGQLSLFVDVFNLYNRSNPQAVDYYALVSGQNLTVETGFQDQLGIMPTFGLRWEF